MRKALTQSRIGKSFTSRVQKSLYFGVQKTIVYFLSFKGYANKDLFLGQRTSNLGWKQMWHGRWKGYIFWKRKAAGRSIRGGVFWNFCERKYQR